MERAYSFNISIRDVCNKIQMYIGVRRLRIRGNTTCKGEFQSFGSDS